MITSWQLSQLKRGDFMTDLITEYKRLYPEAHQVIAYSAWVKPETFLCRDFKDAQKTARNLKNEQYLTEIKPLDD